MRPSIGKSHEELIAEQSEKDPEFFADYEEALAAARWEADLEAAVEQAERQLAAALSTLRQQQSMTQREVAARCRIKQPMINRIETGKQAPTVPTLLKLAIALKAVIQISQEGISVRAAEAPPSRAALSYELYAPEVAALYSSLQGGAIKSTALSMTLPFSTSAVVQSDLLPAPLWGLPMIPGSAGQGQTRLLAVMC